MMKTPSDPSTTKARDDEDEASLSSEDDEVSCSTDLDHTESNDTVKQQILSRKETVAVNRSKIFVYAAIILAAAAVGGLVYAILSKQEYEDFKAG